LQQIGAIFDPRWFNDASLGDTLGGVVTEVKQEMSSISAVWANVLPVFLCLQQRSVKEQAAALAALEGSDYNPQS
jgi:hypothetical protein